MASVFRRRLPNGKRTQRWYYKYRDAAGRWRSGVGTTDKAATLEVARTLEQAELLERTGVVEPGERLRRAAAARPLAAHLDDYRAELAARGNTPAHVRCTVGAIARLLDDAATETVAKILPERVQAALGRLKARRSARTANHARTAVLGFARWLEANGRIKEVPRGLRAIRPFNEKADRRRVRRALAVAEIDRLFAAAEAGPPAWCGSRSKHTSVPVSGPDRAALYRVALATGFRARELRSLTPEAFRLDDEPPRIVVRAGYTKNRDEAPQPVRRADAAALRAWLAGKPPGRPVFGRLPWSLARMLRADLEAAGIPYRDGSGRVADFHALRHSYITTLVKAGVNPKIVQKLARHSTITLTLDRYTDLGDDDVTQALEGP